MATVLLSVITVACSDVSSNEPAGDASAVAFSPRLHAPVTRSTLDNSWTTGQTIRITNGTDTYDYSYDAGTDTWTAVGSKFYWPINNPSWDFEAWPADYGEAPKTEMTVKANQTANTTDTENDGITEASYEDYDLLYCPPTSATYRQPVTLSFLHQMARVVVILNTNNTEEQDEVTKIELGNSHIGLKGSIATQATTSANATWTLDNSSAYTGKTITMRNRTTADEKKRNVYTFECMLPPQRYDTSAKLLSITTDYKDGGTTKHHTFSYTATFNYQSGNVYTYDLAASAAGKIILLNMQVQPWEAVENIDNTAVYDNVYPGSNVVE